MDRRSRYWIRLQHRAFILLDFLLDAKREKSIQPIRGSTMVLGEVYARVTIPHPGSFEALENTAGNL